jgi:hypothetical protein
MFERYSEAAKRAVSLARSEAVASRSGSIECRHLLLGVLKADPELFNEQMGQLSEAFLRDRLLALTAEEISDHNKLPFSDKCKRALYDASVRADASGAIEPRHLFAGLMKHIHIPNRLK